MSTTIVNFPPYQARTPLTNGSGQIEPDAHKSLLQVYNGHPLVKVDTSKGNKPVLVPLAKSNQNVEITYLKVSADANTPILQASGQDSLNAGVAWAVKQLQLGAAQGSKLKLKSDGVSNWYQVG